jgi:hypothetical protein
VGCAAGDLDGSDPGWRLIRTCPPGVSRNIEVRFDGSAVLRLLLLAVSGPAHDISTGGLREGNPQRFQTLSRRGCHYREPPQAATSKMPDYCFRRCDGHHGMLDFSFLPNENPALATLVGEQRAGPGALASPSQAGEAPLKKTQYACQGFGALYLAGLGLWKP